MLGHSKVIAQTDRRTHRQTHRQYETLPSRVRGRKQFRYWHSNPMDLDCMVNCNHTGSILGFNLMFVIHLSPTVLLAIVDVTAINKSRSTRQLPHLTKSLNRKTLLLTNYPPDSPEWCWLQEFFNVKFYCFFLHS